MFTETKAPEFIYGFMALPVPVTNAVRNRYAIVNQNSGARLPIIWNPLAIHCRVIALLLPVSLAAGSPPPGPGTLMWWGHSRSSWRHPLV